MINKIIDLDGHIAVIRCNQYRAKCEGYLFYFCLYFDLFSDLPKQLIIEIWEGSKFFISLFYLEKHS